MHRLPRAVFDFVDGGADDEHTLRGNVAAYSRLRFRPNPLVDVSNVETRVRILERLAKLPIIVAPFGAAGFPWPCGDLAVAQCAADFGIPYAMSSTASVALEEIATRSEGRHWFQSYIFKRREVTAQLIERARNAGFEALIITVDLPVGGNRERDYRNDFAVPFRFTRRNVVDFACHPGWSFATLANGMPTMANLTAFGPMDDVGIAASTVGRNYDPSFNWDDLARIRDSWPRKLIVKGITRAEDARRLVTLGVDAVSVSNHGGRQLDGALPSLYCLPDVRAAVGRRMDVFVDGGIRRGSDIVKAIALGADAVMIGRAVLYGLGAAGGVGVRRTLDILAQELRRTMQLLGATGPDRIDANLIARKDLEDHFDLATVSDLLDERASSAFASRQLTQQMGQR